MKNTLKKGAEKFIQFIKETNIKTMVLSGDSMNNTLPISCQLRFNENKENWKLYTLNSTKYKLHTDLISIIYYINEFLNGNQDKTRLIDSDQRLKKSEIELQDLEKLQLELLISGETFQEILDDSDLKCNFMFVLSMCQHAIGYEFTDKQKMLLTKMIKQKFLGNPNICSIGFGFNQAAMSKVVNCSIELIQRDNYDNLITQNNYADIQVDNFQTIQNIIQVDSMQIFYRQKEIIILTFFGCFTFAMSNFYFNWFSNFTANTLYFSFLLVLYNIILNPIMILAFQKYQKYDKDVLKAFSSFYADGKIVKDLFNYNALLSTFEAFLVSLYVFYVSIYVVSRNIDTTGITANFEVMTILIFLSLQFSFSLKLCMSLFQNKQIIWTIINFILTIFVYIIFLLINYYYNVSQQLHYQLTLMVFLRKELLICLITNILVSLSLALIIKLGWQLFSQNPYDKFILQTNRLSNQSIHEHVLSLYTFNYGQLIKNIFKKKENIEKSIQKLLNVIDSNIQDIKLNMYKLQIKDSKLQQKYQELNLQSGQLSFRFVLLTVFVLLSTLSIIEISLNGSNETIKVIVTICLLLLFFIVVAFSYLDQFTKNYYITGFTLLVLKVLIYNASLWLIIRNTEIDLYVIIFNGISITLIISVNFEFNFLYQSILNLLNIISLFAFIHMKFYYLNENISKDTQKVLFYQLISVHLFGSYILVISIYQFYFNQKQKKTDFLTSESIEMEQAQSDDLLSILVPKFVQERLLLSEGNIKLDQKDVAILFCDICDFDEMLRQEQTRIVNHLDELFRKFDECCVEFGVQKIETVGKTYMAATGIKEVEAQLQSKFTKIDKGLRIIQMAIKMKNIAKQQKIRSNEIKLKIGIHRGEVIAGVIGWHKKQFSLIGDTVNLTSRVCSTGQDQDIMISDHVYSSLNQQEHQLYRFTPKTRFMKGQGDKTVYKVDEINYTDKTKKFRDISNKLYNIALKDHENSMENKSQSSFINLKSMKEKIEENKNLDESKLLNQATLKEDEKEDGLKLQMYTNIQTEQFNEEKSDIQLKIKNKFILNFQNNQEKETSFFNEYLQNKMYAQGFYIQILLFIVYVSSILIMIIVEKSKEILASHFIGAILLVFSIVIQKKAWEKQMIFKTVIFVIFMILIIINWASFYLAEVEELRAIKTVENFMICITFSNLALFQFKYHLIQLGINFCYYLIISLVKFEINFYYLFFIIAYTIIIALKSRQVYQAEIDSFNNVQNIEFHKKKIEEIVLQLLPTHAIMKINYLSQKDQLIDEFHNVSLLYADISGFTEYSRMVKSPQKVLEMLKQLFETFDKLCLQNEVFKLFTIGDCYVVMSFIDANSRNENDPDCILKETRNLTEMGLDMIHKIAKNREQPEYQVITMRVGIHTGSLIGGIIGTEIVRYDIYGPDVCIANKMESSGVKMELKVSEVTKNILSKCDQYTMTFHSTVDVKKLQLEYTEIKSYLVTKNEY